MTNAYQLASDHLDRGIDEAAAENINLNTYGQALVWKLLERYKASGRSAVDIIAEVQYTLDNLDDDGTFHVSRN